MSKLQTPNRPSLFWHDIVIKFDTEAVLRSQRRLLDWIWHRLQYRILSKVCRCWHGYSNFVSNSTYIYQTWLQCRVRKVTEVNPRVDFCMDCVSRAVTCLTQRWVSDPRATNNTAPKLQMILQLFCKYIQCLLPKNWRATAEHAICPPRLVHWYHGCRSVGYNVVGIETKPLH